MLNSTPPPSVPVTQPPPSLHEVAETLALTGSEAWLLVAVGLAIVFFGFVLAVIPRRHIHPLRYLADTGRITTYQRPRRSPHA